jgi:hypothetical protein
MLRRLNQLRRWAGVDRVVFFSNAAQMTRLLTGPITLVLVLRYLTPEIQGYFYAFSGVVAMQVFLEMGFSQNILQFASHEYAKLRFTAEKTLDGDPVAKSRLISLGRLAFGYYAAAGLLFLAAVGIGGHVFFTISDHHHALIHHAAGVGSTTPIMWQGAWWIIAATAALSLVVNPAWSLLQGCDQLAAVAKFNFWATLAVFGANATALIMGAGIYTSAIGTAFNLLISIVYLLLRWRPFFCQFLDRPKHGRMSWAHEIWPFQWRIAVSWMCSYFIFDIINPIAFYFCGPVDAGRLGMSWQLVSMIARVALTWINTKAPRFGMLIAVRAWPELDLLWRRSTIQTITFYLLGYTSFLAVIWLMGHAFFWEAIPRVGHLLPKVLLRLAPLPVNAWMGGALIAQIMLGAMAMELRAHKQEPFMWLSVINAILSVVLMVSFARLWGITGESIGYAVAIWLVFIPGWRIYQTKRLEYRRQVNESASTDATIPAASFSGIGP